MKCKALCEPRIRRVSRPGRSGALLALAALAAAPARAAPRLPEGFAAARAAGGLTGATAMAIAPDGRIFIAEQTGSLRVVKDAVLLEQPFVTLEVDSYWERGLIGVCLDPGFPEKPHVYLNTVAARPFPRHRILRFTALGDRADRASERLLLEGDDQELLGGSIRAGHQGGALRFGPDGMLYIGIGEQTAGEPSQRLDSLLGKVLRIAPDGSIPADNPFYGSTSGKYRAVWARGLRNPFAFAFDPATGRMYINDVGGGAWEEIDEGVPGANYGWPRSEGPAGSPEHRGPVHAYGHGAGKSITGGVFYRPRAPQFPARFVGKYLFADFDAGWIRTLDPDRPERVEAFAAGLKRPVDLQLGPDGSLFVLERNAWVKDGEFKPGTGELLRISWTGREEARGVEVALPGEGHPPLLSQTGVFRSLAALEPAPGVIPYDVNAPLWSDGAFKRRWIRLPQGARIGFSPRGEWRFPRGTVLVKHFEMASGGGERGRRKRLETRLLFVGPEGSGHGVTYRFRPDGSEADLLRESASETVPAPAGAGARERTWYYPSPGDCLTCHTQNSGFVLGVNTRQLNLRFRDPRTGLDEDQLRAWSALGMFAEPPAAEEIARFDRLSAIEDASAPLEHRIRSYLDSNCAQCHRPGGARGLFDARFDTPLGEAGLIDGALATGDLGLQGARNVVPGDPARSILLERMRRLDVFKMPPVAMNEVDAVAVAAFEEWIRGLGSH